MKLALGTVQFGMPYGIANRGGQVPHEEAATILQMARQHGVKLLDTAVGYGESETCLGRIGTEGFDIVTKLVLPHPMHEAPEQWIEAQIRDSLMRLNRQKLYGVLLHRAEQLNGPHQAAIVRAFQRLKQAGLVEKFGVSIYAPDEIAAVLETGVVDLIQAPFNLLDRRLLTTGWLQRLHAAGVEIHVRSVFLQGLLLMSRRAIPERFARWNPLWDAWHDWLQDHPDQSAAQVCLGFAHACAEISRIVIGVDGAEQWRHHLITYGALDAVTWPDLSCDDEALINPARWTLL
ncbi:hypothetical protein SIID45300_02702 [Candidatus Magnetaquicoccaceae bacterium FCR-1]|uniref:NADP-dependent oxidoreductase domain-containing protein n=1 Tax=Candidatus Magnetaquiglobus chichijimensis TaxID=3141448 RepID=A0ABQ0CBS4_9PROT